MADAIVEVMSAIKRDLRQVEVVSQNIANVNTAGYKARQLSGLSFDSLVGADVSVTRLQSAMSIDDAQGVLRSTGDASDLAIIGEGYFVVMDPDTTKRYLSRSLKLRSDADGYLVDHDGFRVQGSNGSILVNGGIPLITEDGKLYQDAGLPGQLLLVKPLPGVMIPLNPERLPFAEHSTEVVDIVSVRQGFIEQSNVSSSEQMIKLMQLSKHIESSQRALVSIDQMLGSGINQIGDR